MGFDHTFGVRDFQYEYEIVLDLFKRICEDEFIRHEDWNGTIEIKKVTLLSICLHHYYHNNIIQALPNIYAHCFVSLIPLIIEHRLNVTQHLYATFASVTYSIGFSLVPVVQLAVPKITSYVWNVTLMAEIADMLWNYARSCQCES